MGRRLDFTVLEPLSQLAKAGSDSNWCTIVEDVRTWLLNAATEFFLPDLGSGLDHESSVPRDGRLA